MLFLDVLAQRGSILIFLLAAINRTRIFYLINLVKLSKQEMYLFMCKLMLAKIKLRGEPFLAQRAGKVLNSLVRSHMSSSITDLRGIN